MQIESTRFGALDVEEHKVLQFPDGLPGFENRHLFTLVPHHTANDDKGSPFIWLQSVEDGGLAFLAMDPLQAFPDYTPHISISDLASISLNAGSESESTRPCLYTLLTVPAGDPCGITANLMAPIVINTKSRLAKQVVLNSDIYGLRHRLLPGD